MKQYVIDQLGGSEVKGIKAYLDRHFRASGIEGVYWCELDEGLLTPCQREHGGCSPHVVAVELEPDRLVCELLVRTQQRVKCECIAYATEAQRNWLIDRIDTMLKEIGATV